MDLLFNIFVLKCMDRDWRSGVVMKRLGTIYAGLLATSRIRLAFEMQSSENFNALEQSFPTAKRPFNFYFQTLLNVINWVT